MAITVVNSAVGGSTEPATNVTSLAAASITTTTGNTIVAFIRYAGGSAGPVDSVTNSAGQKFRRLPMASNTTLGNGVGTSNNVEAFWLPNTTGTVGDVITAASAVGITFASIHVMEISGLPASGALDVGATGIGSASGTASTANFSTTNASEIVCALVTSGSAASAEKVAGTAATTTTTAGSGATAAFYQVQSGTQAGINASATVGTNWTIAAVALSATSITGNLQIVNAQIGGDAEPGAGTTALAAGAMPTTTGNTIVAFIRRGGGGPVTSVTNTAAQTFTNVAAATVTQAGIGTIETWYLQNATGNAADVITANASVALTFASIHVLEIAGAPASGALDIGAAGNNTVGNPATGTFSTAQAAEIVCAMATAGGGTGLTLPLVAGAAATEATCDTVGTNGYNSRSWYQIQSTSQSGITAAATVSSGSWAIASVAIKGSAGPAQSAGVVMAPLIPT